MHKSLLSLMIILSMLCGCSKSTAPMKANYYPRCYEPLAYLHSRSGGTGSAVASGAIQGGVISGIATAIIGAISGRLSPSGILGGVAAGTAVGGLVGGVGKHENTEKQDNQHLAKYLEEIDGDIDNMDITTAAATVSRQCYTKALAKLTGEMKNNTISLAAAKARFDEIKAGNNEACQILGVEPETGEMEKEFKSAER